MNENNDPTLETNVLPDLPDQDEETPTPQPVTKPVAGEPVVPSTPATSDDLRSAMSELAGALKPRTEPTAPQPTPEQIAEYWAIYNPEAKDKEFFKKFGRFGEDATPEQIAAYKELFVDMHGGIMKQSVTAIKNYLQAAQADMDARYGPLREYVEEQQRESTRTRFYGEFPGLNEPRFQKIIDATARGLDNKTFKNESEYFKALAEGAAGSIKEILPDFDVGAKPNNTTQPGKTPKLPRSSAGGGGGAGKGATHDVLAATGSRNDIDSLDEE